MVDLGDWVVGLKEDIAARRSPNSTHQRIIVPGRNLLHSEGFIRFQAVTNLDRPGLLPESLSIMTWMVPSKIAEDRGRQDEISTLFGGLISLLLDRRVEVLNEVALSYEGSSKTTFLPLWDAYDKRLTRKIEQHNLDQDLRESLNRIASMNKKKRQALCAALELHYWACYIIPHDLRTAYTLLVAGVEVLSRVFGAPPKEWNRWQDSDKWDAFMFKAKFSDDQKNELRSELMKDKQLRLKETFVNYVNDNLSNNFWEREWPWSSYQLDIERGEIGDYVDDDNVTVRVSDITPRDREQFKLSLGKTYNARSTWVHAGKHDIGFAEAMPFPRKQGMVSPLSFCVLREILTTLIKSEMASQEVTIETPDIRFTFTEAPEDS